MALGMRYAHASHLLHNMISARHGRCTKIVPQHASVLRLLHHSLHFQFLLQSDQDLSSGLELSNVLTLCPKQTRFYLHFEQRLLQRCVKVFLLQTESWQHLKCHSKPDSHLAVHKHRMQPLTPKLPQVLRKFFAAIQDVNVAILPAPVALRDSVNTSVITVSTRLGSKAVITARLWRPFMKTLCYVANTLSNHTRFEEVCRHSFC